MGISKGEQGFGSANEGLQALQQDYFTYCLTFSLNQNRDFECELFSLFFYFLVQITSNSVHEL